MVRGFVSNWRRTLSSCNSPYVGRCRRRAPALRRLPLIYCSVRLVGLELLVQASVLTPDDCLVGTRRSMTYPRRIHLSQVTVALLSNQTSSPWPSHTGKSHHHLTAGILLPCDPSTPAGDAELPPPRCGSCRGIPALGRGGEPLGRVRWSLPSGYQ